MEEYRVFMIGPDAIFSIGLISAALMREKRGGLQKSPLMATPSSFGKPTASLNVFEPEAFRMLPIGAHSRPGRVGKARPHW
jgi:hypothetical protein